MARLSDNTVLSNPETGAITVLLAGEDVPGWADGMVGDHLLETSGSESDVPPKGGAGSGKDAWAAYAAKHDVDVADDATRDDIIAALDAAGVPSQ